MLVERLVLLPRTSKGFIVDRVVTANDTRLVVLRGPCGAGKTTVASRLLESPRPTALIEQDPYRPYRFIFNVREGEMYSKTGARRRPRS